jgi:hypothetical protein
LIHVSGFQEFELYNILGKIRPSLFVGRGSQVLTAARMGIPSVSADSGAFYGTGGALRFIEAASRAVRFRMFPDILKDIETGEAFDSEASVGGASVGGASVGGASVGGASVGGAFAYERRWAERRPDWYIKLEGKY